MTGRELKHLRESKDLTQSQLADMLGYHHYQRIYEMERAIHRKVGLEVELRLFAAGLTNENPLTRRKNPT